jgi:hypothetical protein
MKPPRKLEGFAVRKWIAVLCVLVMGGFGFAQALHVHDTLASQTSPPSHCSLCVAAHHAAVVTPISAAPTPVLQATALESTELQHHSQLHIGASYIRPPPQNL